MVDEVLHYLITDPSGIYVDGTLGFASHAEALLSRLNKKATLIGIDRDEEAVDYSRKKLSHYGERVQVHHGAFGEIDRHLMKLGIEHIDGIFLDLGLSSYQIDTPERGFSYLQDGHLDMRMEKNLTRTAADIVNRFSESELVRLFQVYGEERQARRIARHIVSARGKAPILRTGELAAIVRKCTNPRWHIKTLARIWQALRIEVNGEMDQLKMCLERSLPFYKPGSRIVILCYEALEDRLVKAFFRGEPLSFIRFAGGQSHMPARFKTLTRAVRPSPLEVARNSRASSARLRAAEYTGMER